MEFINAQEAFEFYYNLILEHGKPLNNTKFIQNEGFYILNPIDNKINTEFRNWKNSYAQLEWDWYLSANRDVSEIKKQAKIWDKMHNGDNLVNSNYGYQWSRNNQLQFIIDELTQNPNSRRAVITIYDGKDHELHSLDTPCTLNIVFNITDDKLNMSVLMRSNDLWFGFCNDQYCFSKLQELIALKLNLEIGWYYHFANNLHLYDKHFDSLINHKNMFIFTKK
jgi:thymidylate synthase